MSYLQACHISKNGEGFYQFANGTVFNLFPTPGYFALHREDGLVKAARKIDSVALPMGLPSDQQLKMVKDNHALAAPDLESHCLDCGQTRLVIFEGEHLQPDEKGAEFLGQTVFNVGLDYLVLPPALPLLPPFCFYTLPPQEIAAVFPVSDLNENILRLFRKSCENVETCLQAYQLSQKMLQKPFPFFFS